MIKKNLPAASSKNEVATVDTSSMMLQDVINNVNGFENMGADDLSIPFISLLQSGSPQCKRKGGEYIEGAEEGMFFNTVTGEILGDEIYVIPCAYEKSYVEWRPRETGGGFVFKHSNPEILKETSLDDKHQNVLQNGNIIVTTAYHYCLRVRDDGTTEPAVISLTSTQLKKSRKWNSQQKALKIQTKNGPVTPPMWSHIYKVTSMHEENDKGSWYLWNFSDPKIIQEAGLYKMAKDFHNDVVQGSVKISVPLEEEKTETNYDDSNTF